MDPPISKVMAISLFTLFMISSLSLPVLNAETTPPPDKPTWEMGDSWKYENYVKGAEKTNYFYKNVTNKGVYVNGMTCYKVEMNQNGTNIANYYNKRNDLARVKVEYLYSNMGQDNDEIITYQPPFTRYEFPLKNGTKWSFETVRTSSEHGKRNISYQVRCFEKANVTTKAGVFEAHLIGISETYPDSDSYHHVYTKIYYSPEVKNEVKQENFQVSQEGELGEPQSSMELVSYDITPPETEEDNDDSSSSSPSVTVFSLILTVVSTAIIVRYKYKR